MKYSILIIILLVLSCNKNQSQTKKNIDSNTMNLILTSNENPIDFDVNEKGIILLSFISKKINNDIITKYNLSHFSKLGKEIKKVTIHTEKNRKSLKNPTEKIEFKNLKFVNNKYLVTGTRITDSNFDFDYHFEVYDEKLEKVSENSLNINENQFIQTVQIHDSRAYTLSINRNLSGTKSNDIFNVNQNIDFLNNNYTKLSNKELLLENIKLPPELNEYSTVEAYNFVVDSENFYIFCRAEKESLFSPLLICVDKKTKILNWFHLIKKVKDSNLYLPNDGINQNNNQIGFTYSFKKQTYICLIDKKGKEKFIFKDDKISGMSLHTKNDDFIICGEVRIDEEIKSKHKNLSDNFYGGKAFKNYYIKINDKGEKINDKVWGNENSETVFKSKVFKNESYFLCRGFILYPNKKIMKIYKE